MDLRDSLILDKSKDDLEDEIVEDNSRIRSEETESRTLIRSIQDIGPERFLVSVQMKVKPRKYSEVISLPESSEWLKAMIEEIE